MGYKIIDSVEEYEDFVRRTRKKSNMYMYLPYVIQQDKNLSDKAKILYALLHFLSFQGKNILAIPISVLAHALGTTRPTARAALQQLASQEYIYVEHRTAATNRIYVLDADTVERIARYQEGLIPAENALSPFAEGFVIALCSISEEFADAFDFLLSFPHPETELYAHMRESQEYNTHLPDPVPVLLRMQSLFVAHVAGRDPADIPPFVLQLLAEKLLPYFSDALPLYTEDTEEEEEAEKEEDMYPEQEEQEEHEEEEVEEEKTEMLVAEKISENVVDNIMREMYGDILSLDTDTP